MKKVWLNYVNFKLLIEFYHILKALGENVTAQS